MNRVYVARVPESGITSSDVHQAIEWLGGQAVIPMDSRVCIKPNLTWPDHMPGVTTTPKAIEAVVCALRDYTAHITIVESDGGYHSFQAEEAFRKHGLYDLQLRYGIRVANLSREPSRSVNVPVAGRSVSLTLPCLLLDETDAFVTVPVPKVHVMTVVSLAFKNQWGCLPSTMRLREHPDFDHKVIGLNRVLAPRMALFDGTYFLDRTGPMYGDAVKMNLLVAGDDVGGASAVCCALMGLDPGRVRHLRLAQKEGMFPASLQEVTLSRPLEPYVGRQFTMRRAFLDWLSLLGFRNGLFTRFFWDSPAAGPLHRLLYAARRSPLVCRMLYGPTGSPPERQETAR